MDGDLRQHAIMVAKQMDGLLWGGGHSLNYPTYSHLIRYQHEVEVTKIISREFTRESVYQISSPPSSSLLLRVIFDTTGVVVSKVEQCLNLFYFVETS